MTIQPRNNRIHVRIHPNDTSLILPSNVAVPLNDVKVEVLAAANGVITCTVGEFVLLHPHTNLILLPGSKTEGLIDASSVMAVVSYDDEIPVLARS